MAFERVASTTSGGTTSYLGSSGSDSIAGVLAETSNVFINGRAGADSNALPNISGHFTNFTLKGGQGKDDLTFLNSTSGLKSSFVNLNKGDDNAAFNHIASSTVLGGQGNDTFSSGMISKSSTLNGNKGNDVIDITGLSASSFYGGQGNDTLDIRGNIDDALTRGDNDDDVITVLNGATNVNHTINGNAGNDSVNINAIASFTSSNINGGAGNDSVNAATSTVGITANGDAGTDTLSGGSGGDVFNGGDGADTIFGLTGTDTLNGGAGDDIFSIAATAEITGDTLTGGTSGQTNGDTVVITGVTDLKGITNATLLTDGQIENVRIDGAVAATFNGSQLTGQAINFNDNAAGNATLDVDVANATAVDLSALTFTAVTGTAFSSGNDIVDIDVTADVASNVTGTSLNDNIQGEDGDDTLLGGAGNDTFGDSAGTDTITGGLGADNMNFTTGNDRAVYTATNEAGDTITGFTVGTDTEVINFGAGVFDGANYTTEGTFTSIKSVTGFGAGGQNTSIAGADLIVNHADSDLANNVFRSAAQVDTLLDAQEGTFDGAVLFATDNGINIQIWYDADADTVDAGGAGTNTTLIATLAGVADANTLTLNDFLIT